MAQAPLPKAAAGAADKITIAGANLSREAPSLADAREKARVLASDAVGDQGVPDPVVEPSVTPRPNALRTWQARLRSGWP